MDKSLFRRFVRTALISTPILALYGVTPFYIFGKVPPQFILIGGLGYDYNSDGMIRSIKIYDYKDSNEPVGKVDLFNNATPLQVAAWKEIAGSFPEPEKPWEVLTMLCNRIEMYGYGSVAGEKIIDGKILTAGNFVFSEEGVLLSKVVNSKTADLVSQGSTPIASSSNSFGVEYKYVPVRR